MRGPRPTIDAAGVYGERMRRLWLIAGIVLVSAGAVWTLQGAGFLKGSFMTGARMWFWIGIACIVAGIVLMSRATRTRRKG